MKFFNTLSQISEVYFLTIGISLLVISLSQLANPNDLRIFAFITLGIGAMFFGINKAKKSNKIHKSTIFNKQNKEVGYILANP